MTISKKAFIGILSLTVAVLLTACSGNTNQGGNTNSSQNTQSQTSQASSNAGQTSNIDGRYQATDHDGDQHVLEINGRTGAWTETEVEGSKEIKQVQVDTASQRLIVGDDVKSYRQNGNQLIVDELDDDPDTLTFSKQ
ncbi:SP_0198 family lipoprotein [Streptococcus cristatus]|uniref:SP_0198 family lipoprotein n=1 Tax=Streptococcus cristatus TaxID=45634 RepID=UPI002283D101|nr:SP_0198 family lipoprotein [Streptococcus cristatus]MCY7217103.1 SP_0198 family lipoprotein [Streptococcus cristatus]